ncbi:MAG: hypothetical protein KatS3mg080_0802 [Anoxybacillus sp.]|nr:MAG: hypothetical protein KatS3mg080_0802 [Anoxybacillus sp.]
MAIRTLLIDSDPIYLLGLEKLLENESNITVVGSVSCIDSLDTFIHIHVPDVIVINVHMHIIKALSWIKKRERNISQDKCHYAMQLSTARLICV